MRVKVSTFEQFVPGIVNSLLRGANITGTWAVLYVHVACFVEMNTAGESHCLQLYDTFGYSLMMKHVSV